MNSFWNGFEKMAGPGVLLDKRWWTETLPYSLSIIGKHVKEHLPSYLSAGALGSSLYTAKKIHGLDKKVSSK